ncbi:MAG: hypothetical protein NTU44_09075 [Bacteroidetes bacterium]|nr:hypothetical protein [Bacteroidota bacterium]
MAHYLYLIGCLIAGILFLTAMFTKRKSRNFRVLLFILGDAVIIGSELYHRSEYYKLQSINDFGSPPVSNSLVIDIVLLILVNVAVFKIIYGKMKNA